MVAASLENAGHDTRQFDFLASERSIETLNTRIKEFNPDIIGISIRNIDNVNLLNEQRYIGTVKDIVREIKKISPAKVILGGSGFSIMPEAILRTVGADYGIAGEGESLILDFINSVSKGVYPKERVLRSDSKLSGGQIPSAYYDESIMRFYLKSGNIASVQTKRGCGHKCIYCSYPVLEGRDIRSRDISAVVDDIKILIDKHQAKYIFFTDSVFNDPAGDYLLLLDEMKKRKINIPWTAFFRPQGLDDRAIELMKETGLKAAEVGSDASSDTTLRKLGKEFLFKDITGCNELFAKFEVAAAHYFMFATPGETKASVLEGIRNIKSLPKTVSFIYMGIRILPGTPLADLAREQGIIKPGQDLLEPVYYIAPEIDRVWLQETLTEAFKGRRNYVFPPDALDDRLALLHKLGHSGSMLIPGSSRLKRKV
jgi:radical SAM superfamily enzyme YgiQ (UPF0313 family)